MCFDLKKSVKTLISFEILVENHRLSTQANLHNQFTGIVFQKICSRKISYEMKAKSHREKIVCECIICIRHMVNEGLQHCAQKAMKLIHLDSELAKCIVCCHANRSQQIIYNFFCSFFLNFFHVVVLIV